MWIWLLLFLAFLLYSVKEPFNGSPYEFVQEQAGDIDNLHDKLKKITLTEAYIDSLQSDSNMTTNQINQLHANLPS
jgi:hypothetical protein